MGTRLVRHGLTAASLMVASGMLLPGGDTTPVGAAASHRASASAQAGRIAAPPGPCVVGLQGFQLPVDAAVLDHFRPPKTRWGAGNRGWEFGAAGGEQVCAVGSGVVTFAGSVAGRGVVSIGHGDGLVSSVTGLRELTVSEGDFVSGGLRVGIARPGLHLGFRLDGEYVDPARFLGGRDHAVLVPVPDD